MSENKHCIMDDQKKSIIMTEEIKEIYEEGIKKIQEEYMSFFENNVADKANQKNNIQRNDPYQRYIPI